MPATPKVRVHLYYTIKEHIWFILHFLSALPTQTIPVFPQVHHKYISYFIIMIHFCTYWFVKNLHSNE